MFDLEKFVKNQSAEDRENLEKWVHSFATHFQEKTRLSQKLALLENENRLLRKKLFGASSEKNPLTQPLIEGELPLFNECELVAQAYDQSGEEASSGESPTPAE